MIVAASKYPSMQTALMRGALGRCPRCGQGALFRRYLKMVDCCPACSEPYGHFRTDDAAPWLTILVVGHIVVPIVLIFEQTLQLAMGLTLAIWLPVIVVLTLLLLPRCKSHCRAHVGGEGGRLGKDLRPSHSAKLGGRSKRSSYTWP
jgi:uncharacterized protein (DUF983 family)